MRSDSGMFCLIGERSLEGDLKKKHLSHRWENILPREKLNFDITGPS